MPYVPYVMTPRDFVEIDGDVREWDEVAASEVPARIMEGWTPILRLQEAVVGPKDYLEARWLMALPRWYGDGDNDDDGETEAIPAEATVEDARDVMRMNDRLNAGKQAYALRAKDFVIFDTETTGFGDDDRIIQISVIDRNGKVLVNERVNPEMPIPAESSAVHGITDAHVADAPTFPEIYRAVRLAMAGKVVLAYNLDFDKRMLDQVCRAHDLPRISKAWADSACVMKLFAAFHGDWNEYHASYRWQKLSTAVGYLGLTWTGEAHDALADVHATKDVLFAMADWTKLDDIPF